MDIRKMTTRSDSITFVIFTYNEEQRIEWAIRNFIGWGNILIVDNYSDDRTVEIARSYGCDVLINRNQGWIEDYETVNRVKAAVQTDWIYWGFADEMADASTLAAIAKAIQSGKYSIVNIMRKNYYYGKFLHDAYANRLNRVFMKDSIDFTNNKIHYFGTVTVPESQICYLDSKHYYIRHFMSYNSKSSLSSIDKYTDIDSMSYDVSGFVLGLKFLKQFIVQYIVRGGYKAGVPALIMVVQTTYYQCVVAMKAYERSHNLNVDGIEKLNDEERSILLKTID